MNLWDSVEDASKEFTFLKGGEVLDLKEVKELYKHTFEYADGSSSDKYIAVLSGDLKLALPVSVARQIKALIVEKVTKVKIIRSGEGLATTWTVAGLQ